MISSVAISDKTPRIAGTPVYQLADAEARRGRVPVGVPRLRSRREVCRAAAN